MPSARPPPHYPITGDKAAEALALVQQRVEALRGIEYPGPIPAYYLSSEGLRHIIESKAEKHYPLERREAIEAFLKSLKAAPAEFDLMGMYHSLLDEQVGGLYDEETGRLYVRQGFEVENSEIARLILAHEICHALQDHAFGLSDALHITDTHDNDRAMAGLSIAEGDAMILMIQYADKYASPAMLREIPGMFLMDQTSLRAVPFFFQQQMVFPYLAGQAFIEHHLQADRLGQRDRFFVNPPVSTRQILHPEEWTGDSASPGSMRWLIREADPVFSPEHGDLPRPPEDYRLVEYNNLGEFGIRTLLKERLGSGLARRAAAGWDGDAWVVFQGDPGRWWFAWETGWDSAEEAREFAHAWVIFWRVISEDRNLGTLEAERQHFRGGEWSVDLHRTGNRVFTTWRNPD